MQTSKGNFVGLVPFTQEPQPLDYHGRPSKKNYRPKMACHSCRDRKVKCDRVRPCNACCSRGKPKECIFPVDANNKAIDQSQEIKLLRRTNQELERRNHELEQILTELDISTTKTESFRGASVAASHPPFKFWESISRTLKSKKSRIEDPKDGLYFGCLSVAEVVSEFQKLKASPTRSSLAYPIPRGVDIYAHQDASADPFPCFWLSAQGTTALTATLPPREDIVTYLEAFDRRSQTVSFPHVPKETMTKEFDEFLSNTAQNAFANPDMLALLFATMALGAQVGAYDKHGDWIPGAMERETKKGDVFIAASMHALRLSSFMNRPTLLCIQSLLLIGSYLVNCGKFLDSWTLFGTTIRLAQSIGLHRNPEYLEPMPPAKGCLVRQTLWWWMLHMDQHYAMTLGRPLGISGIGDCPPPTPLETNSTVLRLATYVNQFTLLSRQILSTDELDNDKIDDFSDRLVQLLDTLPAVVQFDDTWLDPSKEVPEWPLEAYASIFFSKTHNYLILLNRQRQENLLRQSSDISPPSRSLEMPDLGNRSHGRRGYYRVLESCRELLKAFSFVKLRLRPAMMCWTMGQQAFNAAMILTLSMVETRSTSDWSAVMGAYHVFAEMRDKGIHQLAMTACERLMELFRNIGLTADSNESVMGRVGMMLLEDPGLQGFIPAKYGPLSYEMVDIDLPSADRRPPVPTTDQPGQEETRFRAAKRRRYGSASSSIGVGGSSSSHWVRPDRSGSDHSARKWEWHDETRGCFSFNPTNSNESGYHHHLHLHHQLDAFGSVNNDQVKQQPRLQLQHPQFPQKRAYSDSFASSSSSSLSTQPTNAFRPSSTTTTARHNYHHRFPDPATLPTPLTITTAATATATTTNQMDIV